MTNWQKFKHELFIFWHVVLKELPGKIKRQIWNKRLKLWWYELFIRNEEFHPSLDSDFDALLYMGKKERAEYFCDLGERRRIAHERNLAREDKEMGKI